MNTRIQPYPDLSVLDNGTLGKIIRHEQEVFGYRGYGEYLFCSDPKCRRILSIDEVFGVSDDSSSYRPLEELEAGLKEPICCPDCNSKTLPVFDQDAFKPYLAGLYRNAYGSLLFDESDNVRGTCVFQDMTFERFFRDNMDYKETFDWESFRARASEVLGMELNSDSPVVSANRIAIERPYRGEGLFNQMCASTLNLKPENDELPGFSSVRYDGRVLPILEAIGFQRIMDDKYGTLGIGMPRLAQAREAANMPMDEFRKKFRSPIRRIYMDVVRKARQHNAPKHYQDSQLLTALQERMEQGRPKASVYEREAITPEMIAELSENYRALFANEYGQYAFYPSELSPLPPSHFFGSEDFIGLQKLDALDLEEYPHPETGESPILWHSPEVVKKRFSHLAEDGQLAIVRDGNHDRIQAFTFGYSSSLSDAFKNEEWGNPVNYSGLSEHPNIENIDTFLEAINESLSENPETFSTCNSISADSPVYVWNCFGVMPEARRQGLMKEITSRLSESVRNNIPDTNLGVLESQPGSLAFNIFKAAGAVEVPKALKFRGVNGANNSVIMVFPVDRFIQHFSEN